VGTGVGRGVEAAIGRGVGATVGRGVLVGTAVGTGVVIAVVDEAVPASVVCGATAAGTAVARSPSAVEPVGPSPQAAIAVVAMSSTVLSSVRGTEIPSMESLSLRGRLLAEAVVQPRLHGYGGGLHHGGHQAVTITGVPFGAQE
jgi:hypothetical protein